MDDATLNAMAARMASNGEGIDVFIMSEMMNSMAGRSLEAMLPVLEKAHGHLAEGGRVRLSGDVSVEAVECPEGPHGGVWRKAMLSKGSSGLLLTVLELYGEPDPSLDRIVDDVLRKAGKATTERPLRAPGPCRAVKVYAPHDMKAVAACLKADAADEWTSDMVLDAQSTIPPYKGEGTWNEYRSSTVSGKGLDAWPVFFAQADSLFRAVGLSGEMARSAAEVSARNWKSAAVSDEYAAARELGTTLAREDGYLPGRACLASLDALSRISAEKAMVTVAADAASLVRSLADEPGLLENGNFYANDGRNLARPVKAPSGASAFEMEDQNNVFRVALEANGKIAITSVRTGDGLDRPCLDLAFSPDGVGGFRMLGSIGQSSDAIRSWNGFLSGAATLALCAREDAARMSAPVPGR